MDTCGTSSEVALWTRGTPMFGAFVVGHEIRSEDVARRKSGGRWLRGRVIAHDT